MAEQDVRAEVKALTEGSGGVDVAIDAVGRTDVFDMGDPRLTRACGRRGRLLTRGWRRR